MILWLRGSELSVHVNTIVDDETTIACNPIGGNRGVAGSGAEVWMGVEEEGDGEKGWGRRRGVEM